jgi:hypothetical protein
MNYIKLQLTSKLNIYYIIDQTFNFCSYVVDKWYPVSKKLKKMI